VSRTHLAAFAAIWALAVPTSAFAQGKSQDHRKSSPPSKSLLPAPSGIGGGAAATTPFGWLDDASVLEPGSASIAVSAVRWIGVDAAETNVPVVDVGLGVSNRVQLSANVPRVLAGTDPGGGSFGTSYIGVKVGVLDDRRRGVKLAVAPTLELLGTAVASAIDPGASRVQWGLPASVELDSGAARAYAGGGYFSRGVWFGGGGAAVQPSSRVLLSAAFTRSWTTSLSDVLPLGDRVRNEMSAGAYFGLSRSIGLFGSAGHTLATTDANGAGTILSFGISIHGGT
jgi:hypothetical protein